MTTQNTAMKGLLAGLILSFGLVTATSSSAFAKDHRSHLLSQRGAYAQVTTQKPANQFVRYDGYQRDRQDTTPNWLIDRNDPVLNLGRGGAGLTR